MSGESLAGAAGSTGGRPALDGQIEPGMVVLGTDGPLGSVESAVVSPRTGELVNLVVEIAFHAKRFLVLPAGWVASVTGDVVRLSRPRAEALELPVQRRTAEGWLRPGGAEPTPSLPPPGHDAALAIEARGVIEADPLLADGEFVVDVRHGVAELSGRVRSAAAAFQARKLALAVDGIWHVRNHLISDEAVAMEVRRRLLLEPTLATSAIRVTADLGRVRLAGRAADAAAIETARRLAAEVPSARTIESTVEEPGQRPDPTAR